MLKLCWVWWDVCSSLINILEKQIKMCIATGKNNVIMCMKCSINRYLMIGHLKKSWGQLSPYWSSYKVVVLLYVSHGISLENTQLWVNDGHIYGGLIKQSLKFIQWRTNISALVPPLRLKCFACVLSFYLHNKCLS